MLLQPFRKSRNCATLCGRTRFACQLETSQTKEVYESYLNKDTENRLLDSFVKSRLQVPFKKELPKQLDVSAE